MSRIVDFSRRTGAPLLGCLLNLQAAPPTRGGVDLTVDDGLSSVTGLLDVVVAVDLALGYSVRQATEEARWAVPTIDLALQLSVDLPASGTARVAASRALVHTSASLGAATGLVTAAGATIGQCSALFALPHRQPVEPLPWEVQLADKAVAPPSPAEQPDERDDTVRMICEAFTMAGDGGSWLDALLGLVAVSRERGQSIERAFLEPAVVANRAGYVQGAVLFALGAVSPGSADVSLVSADMKFLRPAQAALPLLIEPTVQARGRRTEFTSSRLYQEDQLVAVGSYVFRRL